MSPMAAVFPCIKSLCGKSTMTQNSKDAKGLVPLSLCLAIAVCQSQPSVCHCPQDRPCCAGRLFFCHGRHRFSRCHMVPPCAGRRAFSCNIKCMCLLSSCYHPPPLLLSGFHWLVFPFDIFPSLAHLVSLLAPSLLFSISAFRSVCILSLVEPFRSLCAGCWT